MNEQALRARLCLSGYGELGLATALHLGARELRRRLRGQIEFTIGEIRAIRRFLRLQDADLREIFFADTKKEGLQ